MQLSWCHAALGLVAVLAMVSEVYSSDSSIPRLQGEVRKRIFCNFYGCGSKRSAPKMSDLSPMEANLAVEDFSSEQVPSLDQGENYGNKAMAQEAAFIASQKILRAAAFWEAMKERIQQERESGVQKLFKRNSS